VNHGHVLVNGVRCNIPSRRLKVGDVVQVREKSRNLNIVLEAIQSAERDVPEYLSVDHSKLTASLTQMPQLADVPYPVQMEPNLVVEFYSRN
jgi:small subunit ribosomal protein S4